jgi:hypothetical protein
MKGVRFLRGSTVVRVFMDEGWRERAVAAGLVRGKDYDHMQVLQSGAFDTWVPATQF